MGLLLKPVTRANRAAVLALRIQKSQEGFVETPARCLKEAFWCRLWHPVGIYDAETLIGFAMYGRFPWEGSRGRVWLDRFLIDEKHQGCGYGKQSLHLLVATLFGTYRCDEIFLSIYETNQLAAHLYAEFGFAYNGELDLHKEKIMVLQKETYLSRFGSL